MASYDSIQTDVRAWHFAPDTGFAGCRTLRIVKGAGFDVPLEILCGSWLQPRT